MKKIVLISVMVLLVAGMAFAGQPKLVKATINPEKASIGEKVTITTEFTGKASDIQSITVTVREYPYDAPEIILENDVATDKNIWTASMKIPQDAPNEAFNLDIKAIDKNGKEIVTKEYEKNYWGKTGSVKLTVE